VELDAASGDDDGALIEGPSRSWPLVRHAFASLGLAFAVLIALTASSLEAWLLMGELLIMAIAVWLSPRIGRGTALHIVSGSFLLYQTIVLDVTRATPNLGVVWFLLVPSWATLWGRTRHVLIWVPATAAAIGWTAFRADVADPLWQHPLSLPNLFAVLGLSCVLAIGFHRDRKRRERALQAALRRLQDETQVRMSAEAQVRSVEFARERLLAMLSHELRSPMTSLALTSDMLDEDIASPDSLVRLQRSARATLRTLDDILDLVRLEDGVVPQRREPFSLSALLADVHEVVEPQVDAASVRFEMTVEPNMPDRWAGDRARLRQVLLNVVGNAIKHTREGSIRVRVGVDDEHDGLCFSVDDTGVGIAEEVMQDVFEPWRHGEDARDVAGGVGLGLSISRDFVEAMGGSIEVAKTGPGGTRLEFRVGVEALSGACAAVVKRGPQPSSSLEVHTEALRGREILVVDDDATVRDVVARVLEHAGGSVVAAADGREAEVMLRRRSFDLVVLDLEMPGKTGYDVLEATTRQRPPMLVLSGSLEAEAKAREAGADAFAVKPIRAAALLELAASLVEV